MDLAALRLETEKRLHAAKDRAGAERALQWFIRAFGDAHLILDLEKGGDSSVEAGAAHGVCDRLGYGAFRANDGVNFRLAPGFTPVDDGDGEDTPGGILTLPSGAKLGVVRIGLFDVHTHPALCEVARRDLSLSDDAVCDDKCTSGLELATSNMLLASLERRLLSLKKAGAVGVVVDVTQNGGGSGLSTPMAEMITAVKLRPPRGALLRHRHGAEHIKRELDDVEAFLPKATGPQKAQLAASIASLRSAIEQAEHPCDVSALWEQGATPPSCSMLVSDPPHPLPSPYRYRAGTSVLPLIVLVDEWTGSDAEAFTALLRDNGAATVVGQQTAGAGCGYTDGGILTVLRNSGFHVRIPDCVRFRPDGTNEAVGITPDVFVSFTHRDSPFQRTMKAKTGLEAA